MITKYRPFGELVSLREAMDRLFEESVLPFGWHTIAGGELRPAVDVRETADYVFVVATLPGVKPEELEISLTGQTLSLRGEVKVEKDVKQEEYLLQERRYGLFSRTVELPVHVVGDKAEASFEHGIVTIRIPKAQEAKPRRIAIKTS